MKGSNFIKTLKKISLAFFVLVLCNYSYGKSDKRILKDKCKKYEKDNKHSKCVVSRKSCGKKKFGNGWKQNGKAKGKFRMCVRSDCDRKCRKNLKTKCKTYEKNNKGTKCKIRKTKKGCSKPWEKYGKAVGDYQMCTKVKCNRNCKDKKGKDAAKKICSEIENSSGRPCKIIEAKLFKRDKKACGKGWEKQDKVRYVEGYNANNYIICIKKNFDAANANDLSGSSSKYDRKITKAVNVGISKNMDLKSIEADLNKEICDFIKKHHKPDPRVEFKKCKNDSSPGIKLGTELPSITIKNAKPGGRATRKGNQKIKFDYLLRWKTKGLNLKYKIKTYCKVRKKKNKGRKKDSKCPDITLRLKDFNLSMLGKGTASIDTSGNYDYILDSDEDSFKHNARFSACIKIIGKFEFCPGKVERAVSETLKSEIIKSLNDINTP